MRHIIKIGLLIPALLIGASVAFALSFNFSVSSGKVEVGKTLPISMSFSGGSEIDTIKIDGRYDSNILDAKFSLGGISGKAGSPIILDKSNDGKLDIVIGFPGGAASSGTLGTLSFTGQNVGDADVDVDWELIGGGNTLAEGNTDVEIAVVSPSPTPAPSPSPSPSPTPGPSGTSSSGQVSGESTQSGDSSTSASVQEDINVKTKGGGKVSIQSNTQANQQGTTENQQSIDQSETSGVTGDIALNTDENPGVETAGSRGILQSVWFWVFVVIVFGGGLGVWLRSRRNASLKNINK